MTADEQLEVLRVVIGQADADKDHALSFEEISRHMNKPIYEHIAHDRKVLWEQAVKKASEYLKNKDRNGDRLLSRKELFKV